MRRWLLLAPLAVGLLWPGAVTAQERLTISGQVEGELRADERVQVRVVVRDRRGVRQIDEVSIALQTNGVEVDRLTLEPELLSVALEGQRTTSTLDDEPLVGAYLSVRPSAIEIRARGKELRLSVPLRLTADPPAGSRLVVTARSGLTRAGPMTLGDPSEKARTFSLAALVIAGGIALLAGATIGGSLAARRRRQGPQIYASVRERLRREEDSATAPEEPAERPAADVATRKAAGRRSSAKTATTRTAAKKTTARKPAPRKPTGRKPTAKKATVKKASAKKASAKKPATRSSRTRSSAR